MTKEKEYFIEYSLENDDVKFIKAYELVKRNVEAIKSKDVSDASEYLVVGAAESKDEAKAMCKIFRLVLSAAAAMAEANEKVEEKEEEKEEEFNSDDIKQLLENLIKAIK